MHNAINNLQLNQQSSLLKSRAEPILSSVTQFGRVSDTRQYSVLGCHKPADTEY